MNIELHNLKKCPEHIRAKLFQDIKIIVNKVFHESDQKDLADLYLSESALQASGSVDLFLFRNNSGSIIAFNCLRRVDFKDENGQPVWIYRLALGKQKEFKYSVLLFLFAWVKIVSSMLLHPLTRIYVINVIINPSAYYYTSSIVYQCYPGQKGTMPSHISELVNKYFFSLFNLDCERVSETIFLCKTSHVTLLDNTVLKHRHQKSIPPEIINYKLWNPRYTEGYGLVVIIEATFLNLIMSTLKVWRSLVLKACRKLGGRLALHRG